MNLNEVLDRLLSLADTKDLAGMGRVGIPTGKAMGVRIPELRKLAKEIGRDRLLAARLWAEGWRETRILAVMIDDPQEVTEAQMEAWALDFDGWEVCDQACMNLFEKTEQAYRQAEEWAGRDEEFVKRAGFVLMARLAVSDKQAADSKFAPFLPLIEREAGDERNLVKKGVSWALRQIGKRNRRLLEPALETARRLEKRPEPAAQWVARDAIRELTDPKTVARIKD